MATASSTARRLTRIYIARIRRLDPKLRSDRAPDPANPMPTFSPARRVPHGVTLIGRLFDEGTIARVGLALEKSSGVASQRPPGF